MTSLVIGLKVKPETPKSGNGLKILAARALPVAQLQSWTRVSNPISNPNERPVGLDAHLRPVRQASGHQLLHVAG